VTRPRKPFGANHPGRLPATMMKVLAAEMTDPSRLRRGKQYAKDGSVLDVVIDPGRVTCEIQGSRSTPYVAVVSVKPGDGMPLRRDISTACTCPDDDNFDGNACKHVIASLFTLSDEFLLEPELLDVWRTPSNGDHDDHDDDVEFDDDDLELDEADDQYVRPSRRRGHLRLVGADDDEESRRTRPEAARTDPLAPLLGVPDGATLPEVGAIERIEPQLPRSRELAAVLRDALANLRIDWD